MPTLPAPPARLLLVDRERDAIAAYLHARLPELQIRTADRSAVTPDDLAWADAYMGFRPPPHLGLDALSWVHCTGAGVDAFLFRRPFPERTLLTRTDEPFGHQIAEWCLARTLMFTQDLRELAAAQAQREWQQRYLHSIRDLPVLVVGTGEVGRGIAAAFAALGCAVHGASASGRPMAPFTTVTPASQLAAVVGTAGIVVLALPLTEATCHLVDAALLTRCRGAILLNVGRGALLEESALPAALDAGHLRAVALDVFEVEPLPPESPLWTDPRVVISPHIAGITTVAGAGDSFLQARQALTRGELPALAVDQRRGY